MCVSLFEYVALVRHVGLSKGDTEDILWSPYYTTLSPMGDIRTRRRSGKKTSGRKKRDEGYRQWASKRQRKERERKMGEEEGSWPWTYAASPCQTPLAQATHAYAALLLLLSPLQPSPTPTPWHYLVKQSWRDESGKRRGLPSLSTASTGLLSLDNAAWLYTHTYIYTVVAFSCLANRPRNLWHFWCGPPTERGFINYLGLIIVRCCRTWQFFSVTSAQFLITWNVLTAVSDILQSRHRFFNNFTVFRGLLKTWTTDCIKPQTEHLSLVKPKYLRSPFWLAAVLVTSHDWR